VVVVVTEAVVAVVAAGGVVVVGKVDGGEVSPLGAAVHEARSAPATTADSLIARRVPAAGAPR